MTATTTLLVLGLGTMGVAMARNLTTAGFRVLGWNRSHAGVQALVEHGVTQVDSLAEAAGSADVVRAVLADDAALREVAVSGGVLAARRRGAMSVGLTLLSIAIGPVACDGRETTAPDGLKPEPTKNAVAASVPPVPDAVKLPANASPSVLFAVQGGLVPLFCSDGTTVTGGDDGGCDAVISDGQQVALIGGPPATIGASVELGCGMQTTYDARAVVPEPAAEANLAISPLEAAASVELAPRSFPVAEHERAAMTKLVADEVAGRYSGPPRLTWTSGITADIDGDSKMDRVVAAHEPDMLIGLVVFFPGGGGSNEHGHPRVLSMMQFDQPRVIARSSLDGLPGDEIVVDAAFVEGIGDQTVTSAVSTRVIAWDGTQGIVLGSWGCRMF